MFTRSKQLTSMEFDMHPSFKVIFNLFKWGVGFGFEYVEFEVHAWTSMHDIHVG